MPAEQRATKDLERRNDAIHMQGNEGQRQREQRMRGHHEADTSVHAV